MHLVFVAGCEYSKSFLIRLLWSKQNQCRKWRSNFRERLSRRPKREKSCSSLTILWLSSRLINQSIFQDKQVSC